jgi:hypothetical protein
MFLLMKLMTVCRKKVKHSCNMNAFFSLDLFMVYIQEYKQHLRTMK